jgi:hypothetical protein
MYGAFPILLLEFPDYLRSLAESTYDMLYVGSLTVHDPGLIDATIAYTTVVYIIKKRIGAICRNKQINNKALDPFYCQ